MNNENFNPVDDFYVINNSSIKLTELLDSYEKFENELTKLPRKHRPADDSSILKLFKEVQSYCKGEVLYRKKDDASSALSILWLSKVKELATYYVAFNEITEFVGITKEELNEISKLSQDVENLVTLVDVFADKGIIFITEPCIAGSKLDGAVFILDSGQAVIALSLRYNRLDNFWFTLMHELSHLCLHADSLHSAIIEDLDAASDDLIEMQADKLALNSFVPRSVWRNCPPKYDLSVQCVVDFAKQEGIHPSIVAGRLRQELNRFELFKDLIYEVDVREVFN